MDNSETISKLGVNSGAWPAHCSLFAAEKHALVIGHLGGHHNIISEYMKVIFETSSDRSEAGCVRRGMFNVLWDYVLARI